MTLPSGTVTFLRSDIEGSMAHARVLGARYDQLNAEHAALVRAAVAKHGGEVVRTEGDAFFAVFTEADTAARAAVDVQRAMAGHAWPEGHQLRLRIGLHTGAATRAGDDYGGFEVSRAARIAAVGHGGQIVISDPTRALLAADLPDAWRIEDLGRVRLKGVAEPEPLFGLTAPGLATRFDPLRSDSSRAAHLPQRLSTFVGREAELATLGELLGSTRLLTLTGPGGTGKTTLAIELARRHAMDYADGAWFADLQAVTDVAQVRAQLAHALGVFDGPAGPASERLLPFVSERELLLIVDNFEQLLGASDVLAELLAASSATRVIVTSRAPLRLTAEQEYAVQPLSRESGAGMSEAVRLFVERARKSRPDYDPRDEELAAIDRLCRLVDGLPLAIELCAARISVLPAERIHDRLSRRLPLPGSGPRDLPARQRTIEDTVVWGLELLDEPLQRLFARLGVFGTSFELEQAEPVCADLVAGVDVLEGLAQLVEQSLLTRLEDPIGGVRFGMLEPIRMVARARLDASGEGEEFRARHARAYLALLDGIFPMHHEPAVPTWLVRLEADDDNLASATTWAIEARATAEALGLVGYLWRYWVHSGRLADGWQFTERALSLPEANAPSEARVWAIGAAGSLAWWSNELERADSCYEEQRALAAALTLPLGEAIASFNLIFTRRALGDTDGASSAGADATRILTELGATAVLEDIEASLAATSAPQVLVDPQGQLPVLAERIARLEHASSPASQAALPAIRALYHVGSGDGRRALTEFITALRTAIAWRHIGDVISSLSFLATLSVGRLPPEIPAVVFGAIESAIQRYGVTGPRWADLVPQQLPADPLAVLGEEMGSELLAEALDRGQHMTLEEVVDFYEAQADSLGSLRTTDGADPPSGISLPS